MKTISIKMGVTLLLLMFSLVQMEAQHTASFDVKFLKAKFTDTTSKKDVIVIFLITVKDTADYPPVFGLPPKCAILVNGVEQNVVFTHDNLAVSIDDDRIIIKNVGIYDLIKDKVDLNTKDKIIILSFKIKDISSDYFNKMNWTMALTEKRAPKRRIESSFELDVVR